MYNRIHGQSDDVLFRIAATVGQTVMATVAGLSAMGCGLLSQIIIGGIVGIGALIAAFFSFTEPAGVAAAA